MPTPGKPYLVLADEKKSHRTKAELEQRKKEETALLTGVALKEHPEVKDNPVAHAEFQRLNKLLKKINKNDAIYEGSINRYCIITAECNEFEKFKDDIIKELSQLDSMLSEKKIESMDYLAYKDKLQNKLIVIDRQIQAKRKMLLDVEKENVMTIASALRSIPKTVDTKPSKLAAALK
jgi:phage terminase small subunit